MKKLRWLAPVPLAVAVGVFPVLTPVWAAPRPVAPSVHTFPLAGVSTSAMAAAPQAYDPQSVNGASVGAKPRVATTKQPAVFTSPISTGRFTAAGVTWEGNAVTKIVVQVRIRENNTWTDWQSLEQSDGADPGSQDAKHAGVRRSTEPIASANADQVQVRVDSAGAATPPKLSLMTVDPGTSPADANLAATPASSAQAGTLAPTIITRAQWGADESMRDCSPTYSSTIKAGFVHHTVNSNTYSAADVPALVRGIYAYHVNGNGWCDVGYQFIVDRFGRIFEGRAGGVDKPVIGAQAGGFNTYTFGVSGLGDFSSAQPSSAMVAGISQVVGWKLGLHNRDPYGTAVLVSAGGSATAHVAGTLVRVNVVSGHRDVDLTGCPMNLYSYLGSIRAQAAQYKGSHATPNEDLYGTQTGSTGSGDFEVHAQSASSGYSQRLVDAATSIAANSAGTWRFFVGSWNADTRPDLIAVRTSGSSSGRVEVRVVSWASNYRDTVLTTTTPMTSLDLNSWQVAVGGPGGGNVYFIGLNGTGSGTVEVHALSASSNYSQFFVHSTTILRTPMSSSGNRFLVASGSGDLYFVAHTATGSGRTELHGLAAGGGYRGWVAHAITAAGYTRDATATWALGTNGPPYLYFVALSATGSGKVEVHRLSPGNHYASWTLHAATSLPLAPYPTWQFSVG